MKPLIAILLILLFISCDIERKPREENDHSTQLTQEQLSLLQPGDIILRRGDGSLSTQIIKMMKEDNNISHCGIVVKDNGAWKVVHSLGGPTAAKDGVQMEPLQDFVRKTIDKTVYIARPTFSDSLEYLIPYHAKKYESMNIPFDYYFNIESDSSFGCTEFIYKVFKDITDNEIFIVEDKRGLLLLHFTTFFVEENFEKVLDLRPKTSGFQVY